MPCSAPAMESTKNLEVLAAEQTSIGMIALRTRELVKQPGTLVTELTIDHTLLMSSYNLDSEVAFSTSGIAHHGGEGLSVLVGGLGLGHTADALLGSDKVASVEVVEFLEPIIGWLDQGLLPLSEKLTGDSRFSVVHGDVYGRLAGPVANAFDLIVVDVDHSPTEPLGDESAHFHTDAGLELAKRHLAPGGVMGVWSCGPNDEFAAAMKRVFTHGSVEGVEFFNVITEEQETNWLFFGWQ